MLSINDRIHSMYDSLIQFPDGRPKSEGDPFTRYRSWEYCHKAFNDLHTKLHTKQINNHVLTEEDIDTLALHLAFYLASWGMYRGSSFLLQRDYKTHKKAVKVIMDAADNLWNYDPSRQHNEDDDKVVAKGILDLSDEVTKRYQPILEKAADECCKYYFSIFLSDGKTRKIEIVENEETVFVKKGGVKTVQIDPETKHIKYKIQKDEFADLGFAYDDPMFSEMTYESFPNIVKVTNDEPFSETLVTKILMGTIGSVPAYDRFLKNAIVESKIPNLTARFNQNGLTALYAFARDNYQQLNIETRPYSYPIMKKVDMYFWQYGYELGFLDEDSQFKKLLSKGEANHSNKDKASVNKIKAQLETFIRGCTTLEEYNAELKRRNAP